MSLSEMGVWFQDTKNTMLACVQREMRTLWTTHLSRIDVAIANPGTTPATFKEVLASSVFDAQIKQLRASYFEQLEAVFATFSVQYQAGINDLGRLPTPADPEWKRNYLLRMRANTQKMFAGTTAGIVRGSRETAVEDFASDLAEICVHRADPGEVLRMLEKEKFEEVTHPAVTPFMVDGLLVGPTSRSGHPLVLRKVCGHCGTAFHGTSVHKVVAKKRYLEEILMRQCPLGPGVLCVDALQLARVTHTGPSDEYVQSLRDVCTDHYKAARADINKRHKDKQKRLKDAMQ